MAPRHHGVFARNGYRSASSTSSWRNAMGALQPTSQSASVCIQELLAATGAAKDIPHLEIAADLGKLLHLVTTAADVVEYSAPLLSDDVSRAADCTPSQGSGASGMLQQDMCRLLAGVASHIPLTLPPAQLLSTTSFLCSAPASISLQITALHALGHLLGTPASPLPPQDAASILRLLCASARVPGGATRREQRVAGLGEEVEAERRSAAFGAMDSFLESMVGAAGPAIGPEGIQEVMQAVGEVLERVGPAVLSQQHARLYTRALRTPLSLLTPPSPLSPSQVTSWVGGLIPIISYGLASLPPLPPQPPYRPPQLRGGGGEGGEYSSGSEQSEGEGEGWKTSQVRVAALLCLQALARSDPKALHAHWPSLLPTRHVLQPRPQEPTLLTAVLFDPKPKARLAATSALCGMLEGPSTRPFLQVGEAGVVGGRGGSFTPLSALLGQILVQLHTALLHGVASEADPQVVGGMLRALTLLIVSAPYPRLPSELLPAVLTGVHHRLRLLLDRSPSPDIKGAAAAAAVCLGAVFSATPTAPTLSPALLSPPLLSLTTSPPSVEGYHALCCAAYGYPHAIRPLWPQLSATISGAVLTGGSSEAGAVKALQAAMKLMDAILRAVAGVGGREGEGEGMGIREWEEALECHLSVCTDHRAPTVRAAALLCFAGLTPALYVGLPGGRREHIVRQVVRGGRDRLGQGEPTLSLVC